jgi:hypothetical protein
MQSRTIFSAKMFPEIASGQFGGFWDREMETEIAPQQRAETKQAVRGPPRRLSKTERFLRRAVQKLTLT